MQEAVGIRKLRDELTQQIARVRRGRRLVVTDRGKPVAVLMPYGQDAESSRQDRLRALLVGGHVAPAERPFSANPPLVKGHGPLASDLVVEDRR
jgi:prevent-host-death family protein